MILRNVYIYQWTPFHIPQALNPYQHRHARPAEGCRNHLPSTRVLYLHCQFRLRVDTHLQKYLNVLYHCDKHRSKKRHNNPLETQTCHAICKQAFIKPLSDMRSINEPSITNYECFTFLVRIVKFLSAWCNSLWGSNHI
jgi:hypothetical protein